MFSEKALAECPAGREHPLPAEQGVHPGNGRGGRGIFDAVAGERVVFDSSGMNVPPISL